MKIETGFQIAHPPAETYARLLELEAVTPCFPGAELGELRWELGVGDRFVGQFRP